MEQIRIIKEMREHDRQLHLRGADEPLHPRFGIWENVPGALSSNHGEDFRAVLEEFVRVKESGFTVPRCKKWAKAGAIIGDTWSIAWRIMDAQYWGVPQRRRRIAVLVDYESQDAANILLCDDVQPNGETRESGGEPSIVGTGFGCGHNEVRTIGEGLSGNFESCIPAWEGIATDPERSTPECNTLKLRHTGSDTSGGESEY